MKLTKRCTSTRPRQAQDPNRTKIQIPRYSAAEIGRVTLVSDWTTESRSSDLRHDERLLVAAPVAPPLTFGRRGTNRDRKGNAADESLATRLPHAIARSVSSPVTTIGASNQRLQAG